ncbi:MAG: LuxR C-terminal-related transcriptional regulator [Lachnospiraceae bacterium]|nr:LuxR C-terminal-related transcriptional regulator [Lachnospiraceae bacterium]
MGIAGMRKRVCSVHGYFDIEAEMGFAIHMVLPLKFVDARIHPNDNFRGNKYTKRELEIVEAVAEGLSNKEIAARLYISEGTVKNHISTILDKEGLVHRTQLAVYYLTGRK